MPYYQFTDAGPMAQAGNKKRGLWSSATTGLSAAATVNKHLGCLYVLPIVNKTS